MPPTPPSKWNTIYTRLPYKEFILVRRYAKAENLTVALYVRSIVVKTVIAREKKEQKATEKGQGE